MLFGPSMKNLVKKQLSFPEEKKALPRIQGGRFGLICRWRKWSVMLPQ